MKRRMVYVIAFIVLLAVWMLLMFFRRDYVPNLWLILYMLLLFAVPIVFLRIAISRFSNVAANEATKMLLAAVSVAVVLFWVMQGYLAARLRVDLSGEAYKADQGYLVLASLRIANIGNSNVSVEHANLTIVPEDPRARCPSGSFNAESLSLNAGPNKKPWMARLGIDSEYYTIVWGTEEVREAVAECTASSSYRLVLDLFVRQAFTNTAQTWRATAVVPVL